MKILHIIHEGKVGGTVSNLIEVIRHLDSSEFSSVVVSFSHGTMVEQLRAMGVKCHVIHKNLRYSLQNTRALYKVMLDEQPDLVHAHDRKSGYYALYASYRLHVPLLYHPRSWSFHESSFILKKSYLKFKERLLVHLAKLNISVSDIHQEEGKQHLGMPRSIVVPPGVDLSRFNPRHETTLTKKCFGIPEDRTVVGFLARLTEKKDPLTFLRAASLALKEDRRLHFIITGDGELKQACLQEIQNLNLGNHVTFETYRTDVADVLKVFDIYCLPSQWEGLSVGILEAMAMEKAIIASPVNSTLEIIANGIDGMLAAVGTPENWKKAILDLHYNPRLRQELGTRARMIVESHYNITLTSAKLASAYHRVLKEDTGERVLSKRVLESV